MLGLWNADQVFQWGAHLIPALHYLFERKTLMQQIEMRDVHEPSFLRDLEQAVLKLRWWHLAVAILSVLTACFSAAMKLSSCIPRGAYGSVWTPAVSPISANRNARGNLAFLSGRTLLSEICL